MKRAVCVVLLFTIVVVCVACGGPYRGKEDEVKEILDGILDKEVELLGYLYGDSFQTMDEVDPEDAAYTQTAKYYRVSADSPYHSTEELMEAVKAIYSENRSEEIQSGLLEEADQGFPRFNDYKGTNVAGEEIYTDLAIDVTANHPPRQMRAILLLGTLEVSRSTETIIECTLDYRDSETGVVSDMRLKLVSEDGVWKLDNSTWAKEIEK